MTILDILQLLVTIIGVLTPIGVVGKAIWDWIERRKGILSWNLVDKGVGLLTKKIQESHYNPDVIVGVGRGGSIVGAMISATLDKDGIIPLTTVDRKYYKRGKVEIIFYDDLKRLNGKKVLLATAEVYRGKTLDTTRELVLNESPDEVKVATLLKTVYSPSEAFDVDYFAFEIEPRPGGRSRMPWHPRDSYDDYPGYD